MNGEGNNNLKDKMIGETDVKFKNEQVKNENEELKAKDIDDNSEAKVADEELVLLAQKGNRQALEKLINKYNNSVKAKSKTYFLIGADKEDIYQEGMIGLYKAIRDYNCDKLSSFKVFAELCINRQIITAIKTATRQKHIPLNTYVSLNKPIYDDESERTLMDIISGIRVTNPEDLIVNEEEVNQIREYIDKVLSNFEKEVLNCYINGKSYQEIACTLDRDPKSVDNALQRVKKKLENCLKGQK